MIAVADWTEGDSPTGGSWARVPDGTGAFETRTTATPAASNGDGDTRTRIHAAAR